MEKLQSSVIETPRPIPGKGVNYGFKTKRQEYRNYVAGVKRQSLPHALCYLKNLISYPCIGIFRILRYEWIFVDNSTCKNWSFNGKILWYVYVKEDVLIVENLKKRKTERHNKFFKLLLNVQIEKKYRLFSGLIICRNA